MKRIFFILAILLLLSRQCRAESMGASSIEWLSCQSEVIVLGKIDKISGEDCTVKIAEVIKGDIKDKELTFYLRTQPFQPTAKDFVNSDQGVLLFLSKSKDNGSKNHLDYNQYVPTSLDFPLSLINLSNVPKGLFSKEMTVLSDSKEILEMVRTWANSKVSDSLVFEVPMESPVFGQLYGGSACYLTVPVEEKYRANFLKLARSDEPYERQKAASQLSKFPGQETKAVLRELLADKTENVWTYSEDTISKIEYGVRAAASQSLKTLGKTVPPLELERKPTDAEQRSYRQSCWRKSFTQALPEGWKVISVEDGQTHNIQGRDCVSVVVICGKGDVHCKFTLVPKEWDKKDFPTDGSLGNNGRNSQGSRFFFADGEAPDEVKEKLIKYFGLEKF